MVYTPRFNGITPMGGPNPFATASTGPHRTFVDTAAKPSFQDMLANMTQETDKTLAAPDDLMQRAMTTGDVDLHEVMIANTKADLAVNIASQVVTKVIQAYERIQQIQV